MKVSSYTASGLGMGNMPAITISTNSMNAAGKVSRRSFSQSKNRKRNLNYNPREISSAILRANKSQSAGRVVVQAKNKLTNLLKCKGSGQYNEGELNMAIAHAKRMVQCAQLKTQNLRQEERSRKRYENEAKQELRHEKNELKARAARKEQNLEQKYGIERMQRIQRQKSEKRELIRKKKFHRSQERSKLNEADMDYLKRQLRDLRVPYSAADANTGVVLDLSAQAMQLTEAQIEQEMAQVEGMADIAMSGISTGSAAGVSAGEAAPGAAVPVAASVNILV